MIEINKNSWHGRLTKYTWGEDHIKNTRSLCPYFWSVVVAIFIGPVRWLVWKVEDWGHWMRVVIGLGILILALGIYYRPEPTFWMTIIILIGGNIIWFMWQVGVWYEKRHPYVPTYGVRPPHMKTKQPGLLKTWLNAKKDKVCPIIMEVE